MHWTYLIPLLPIIAGELTVLALVATRARTRPWATGLRLTWALVVDCGDTARAVKSTSKRDPWPIRWVLAHQALLSLILGEMAARRLLKMGVAEADTGQLLRMTRGKFRCAVELLAPGATATDPARGDDGGDPGDGWLDPVLRAFALQVGDAAWANVRGKTLPLWHGTGTCLLPAIRAVGLDPGAMPADIRQAIMSARDVLGEHAHLGPRTRDVRSPGVESSIALTLDGRVEGEPERILRCALAPGLPAFAYELLGTGDTEDTACLSDRERSELRSARVVGERLRQGNRVVLLRVRATPALLDQWGLRPTTTDFGAFTERVVVPFLRDRLARREQISAPALSEVAQWTFGSPADPAEVRVSFVPCDAIDILVRSGSWVPIAEAREADVYAVSPRGS